MGRVTQLHTEYAAGGPERVRAVDVEKTHGAAAAAEASADGGGEAAAAADTSLYVALGVEPSASEAELKRGYYRKSLRLHPDKNPDDPDAAARFMEVSHAYQTLSNPQRRAAYDRDGLAAVAKADAAGQDGALFEARMLFSTIFGSEDFEALVGQFSMAAEMAVEGREISADERKFRQLLREVECAAALATRLGGAPADGSSDEAFCSAQAAFAATLCATPFGQRLLHLVGSTYVALADAYLASFAEGVALTIGHEAQRLGSRLSVVGAFAGAASSTHRAMRAEKEKAEADAEASQSELRRVQTAEHAAAAAAALDSPERWRRRWPPPRSTVAAARAKRAAEAASVRAKRTPPSTPSTSLARLRVRRRGPSARWCTRHSTTGRSTRRRGCGAPSSLRPSSAPPPPPADRRGHRATLRRPTAQAARTRRRGRRARPPPPPTATAAAAAAAAATCRRGCCRATCW